ncbi:MAG: type II toxin-antitoxin system PemK/MazF family toxin [Candidatus Taylorbacteria bacterium]|nr:type II toxin-antitoxin system PemK/MazF family toxin [Candidatus Taylorbacteria bacterium]
MRKDFQKWHTKKELLDKEKNRPLFNEQEVWFCSLGANVGSEQNGVGGEFLRPVVIVKKFNTEIFWGIPTTKKEREGDFYFYFSFQENDFTTAILSQIRLIDAKRLSHQIGRMRRNDFKEMKKRLTSFLK